MINKTVLDTLKEVKKEEEKNGAATAPKIQTYKHRSNKYPALKKMVALGLINKNPAPKNMKLENTYTITDFGKTLLEKTDNYREQHG